MRARVHARYGNGCAGGSIRRECFDHVIALHEAHARRIAREYIAYYHEAAGGGLHYYNLVISHALLDANAKRLPSGDQRGILARERIEPDAVSSAAFGGRRKPVLTTCTSRLG